MNNIRVTHLSEDISIAQHQEFEGGVSEVTSVQEVAILPSGSDDWVIMRYDNTLDSLIETLQNARTLIEKRRDVEHDIPKVWDADDIIDTYDSSPDITLKELSLRSGWSVGELLSLLTHDANYHD
tara:strand:- start:686 stop:1060 length:375 start_codon:yes stop_codon:yes gene_type:complete